MSKDSLYCSFCGKSQHEVRKLIAGPSVMICDECTFLCTSIVLEEDKQGEDQRALRGLIGTLTEAQRDALLAYEGPEWVGGKPDLKPAPPLSKSEQQHEQIMAQMTELIALLESNRVPRYVSEQQAAIIDRLTKQNDDLSDVVSDLQGKMLELRAMYEAHVPLPDESERD